MSFPWMSEINLIGFFVACRRNDATVARSVGRRHAQTIFYLISIINSPEINQVTVCTTNLF